MKLTMEEMTKQMAALIEGYPGLHREKACADCGIFPPFEPQQFNQYDRSGTLESSGKWELNSVKEDYTGWVTFSVIGPGPFNRKICPACAKKRTMI